MSENIGIEQFLVGGNRLEVNGRKNSFTLFGGAWSNQNYWAGGILQNFPLGFTEGKAQSVFFFLGGSRIRSAPKLFADLRIERCHSLDQRSQFCSPALPFAEGREFHPQTTRCF